MKTNRFGSLIAIMLMLCLVFVAMSVMGDRESQDIDVNKLLKDEVGDKGLDALYAKYNVTENETKYINGELPHWLDGTILENGGPRVLATPDGDDGSFVKGEDYDILITIEEYENITDKAAADYLEKYGVDVNDVNKFDKSNGILLPAEAVRNYVFKYGFNITDN
jgi:hypothetical protein